MKCESCGNEGFGRFCTNCGAPLPVQDEVAEVVEPEVIAAPVFDHAPGMGSAQEEVPVYDAEPVQEQAAPTVTPGNSSEGILGQAWKDVSKDPSIKKKAVLLGLINCVPILNFVGAGYMLKWGKTAAFRSGDTLPEKIFANRTFETGFFAFVVVLVWSLALGLIGIVPLVGWLVVLAAAPFVYLAAMLMVMVDELGAGFRIKDLWEVGKRNFGGLLLIGYVPGLIAAGIMCVIVTVFSLIFGFNIAVLAVGGDPEMMAVALTSVVWVVLFIVLAIVMSALSSVANLVVYRALGYWIGRMAPEWVQESVSKGTGV